MKKIVLLGIMIGILAVLTGPAYAFVNLGFETGNLTGWALSGGGDAQDHSVLLYGSSAPNSSVEDYYLKILGDGSANQWVSVQQTSTLTAGYTLEGIARFDYVDWGAPWLDQARVAILDATGAVIAEPFFQAGSDVGWTEWSWTAPSDGSYTLVLSARNIYDSAYPSAGYFDVYGSNAVPEPASLILLGTGLAGLAGFRRKKV